MPTKRPRKASSMSRWVHGANNRAAAINLSRPLQPTYFWSLGRNAEYMRQIFNERDERSEPSLTSESNQSSEHSGTCHRNRTTPCSGSSHCNVNACKHQSSSECADCKCYNCDCDGDKERDNHTAIADHQRERTSTGIWIGNELGTTQRSDTISTDPIEYITGIPTGVTI